MTELLIAFVIPILVILFAIVLQTILHCPYKVTAIIFIILITIAIILSVIFGNTLLFILLAWLYTFIAFVTALAVKKFFRCRCNSTINLETNLDEEDDNDEPDNFSINIGSNNNGSFNNNFNNGNNSQSNRCRRNRRG